MKKVYIETTVPSFYHETRHDSETVARRHWTRFWWDHRRHNFELVTSVVVIDELANKRNPMRDLKLALMDGIDVLAINNAIRDIASVYIRRFVMPQKPAADALHVAIASYHKIDMVLTWNCAHIANANKFDHICRVNSMLGLFTPILTTPLNLLGDDAHEND